MFVLHAQVTMFSSCNSGCGSHGSCGCGSNCNNSTGSKNGRLSFRDDNLSDVRQSCWCEWLKPRTISDLLSVDTSTQSCITDSVESHAVKRLLKGCENVCEGLEKLVKRLPHIAHVTAWQHVHGRSFCVQPLRNLLVILQELQPPLLKIWEHMHRPLFTSIKR